MSLSTQTSLQLLKCYFHSIYWMIFPWCSMHFACLSEWEQKEKMSRIFSKVAGVQ